MMTGDLLGFFLIFGLVCIALGLGIGKLKEALSGSRRTSYSSFSPSQLPNTTRKAYKDADPGGDDSDRRPTREEILAMELSVFYEQLKKDEAEAKEKERRGED